MNTNLALLLLAPFSRIFYLIFSSEKVLEKPLLEFLGLLWLLFLWCYITLFDK
jgi:hypothetical protein